MNRAEILVVDDEDNVATTIRAILQLDGHEVTAVTTGAEALRLLAERQFDVVLTDLRLGDVDGVDILREVRRSSPDTAAIMLTGYASLESAISALRAGAYDYLMKPSDVEELRATVARALERRALRQRLVELEEVDRLKSQFLSIASHELKTPLTVIAGLVQISERRIARAATREGLPADLRDDAARTRDALGTAHRQTIRLARLIEELLDLSRLETGRIEMRHVALDAVALVHEVAERMRMADPAAVIEIAPSDDQAMVVADQDRLEQVVENLVANALKYSAPGSPVRLCVSVTAGSLDIAVEDHGVGIPHEELTRIFDLFYRSVEARMARPEGLGLGLFISHEIVTRLGGTLTVDSSVGVGSTFHVRLPLAVAHSLEAGDAAPVKDREAATKG